ncbi:MAG: TauD/TfdA family dioxygenase [Alphaproteobacteria bacterium]|nr:TauD/TfdA family dioxygenase [Alphaproteobacteria bacterium]
MATERAPFETRAAWRGRDLEASKAWVRSFGARELGEIGAALEASRRLPLFEITKRDFPLHATADFLAEVSEELENGLGLIRISGIDAARHSEDELRRIFWGLCSHLGTAMYQNGHGEIMGEVRDETRDVSPSYIDHGEGRVKSSRARSRSTGPLRFHTDRCDVIALLCARNGKAGGISKLASSVTIFNEILKRRPDLIEVMLRDFWRSRPEDDDGGAGGRLVALPIFGIREGKLTSQYSRTFVEQAQEYREVPRLTPAQIEAMDLLAEIAEEVCLHAPFVPGDLQLLNNHVVYHGRTAYEDDATSAQARLLYRLWLSVPNSRILPAGFDGFWGSIESGAIRGGAEQENQQRSPLVPAD